jgi:hypothetical protein
MKRIRPILVFTSLLVGGGALLSLFLYRHDLTTLFNGLTKSNKPAKTRSDEFKEVIDRAHQDEKEGKPLDGVERMDRFAPDIEDVPEEWRWPWLIRKTVLLHAACKLSVSEADVRELRAQRDKILSDALELADKDADPSKLAHNYTKAVELWFRHEDELKDK